MLLSQVACAVQPKSRTIVLAPSIGEHTLVYDALSTGSSPKTTGALTTQSSGSTMVVIVAWGWYLNVATPTDSKSNTYSIVGSAHGYTLYPDARTAVYIKNSAVGGASHTVSVTKTNTSTDEVTLAVLEIKNGGVVQSSSWVEVSSGSALTSGSVTTTGPAVLIAVWFGDNGSGPHTATPNNGFSVVESLLISGSIVQCSVATKQVMDAGTYNVTWTATPTQGAQLYLLAIQKG